MSLCSSGGFGIINTAMLVRKRAGNSPDSDKK
jgi:hypothetical protein